MQPNAFHHNGSSICEAQREGYQTSYVFHLENPIRFEKEIRVSIEHGHGNHLRNEMASVAYWYQIEPHEPFGILPARQRQPVLKDGNGEWIFDPRARTPRTEPPLNDEMRRMKAQWAEREKNGGD
jgi:hypothetical protein